MNKTVPSLFHVRLLASELDERMRKNARYSLRAFALNLDLHPSALSRILTEKQPLSKAASIKVTEKLRLSKEQRRLFLQSVVNEHQRIAASKLGRACEAPGLRPNPKQIDETDYTKIASICSLAIRELIFTR